MNNKAFSEVIPNLKPKDFSRWHREISALFDQKSYFSVLTSPCHKNQRSKKEKTSQLTSCLDLLIPGIRKVIYYPIDREQKKEIRLKDWIQEKNKQLSSDWNWSSFTESKDHVIESDNHCNHLRYILECEKKEVDWFSLFQASYDPYFLTNLSVYLPASGIRYARKNVTDSKVFVSISSSAYTFMDLTFFEKTDISPRLFDIAMNETKITNRFRNLFRT